MPMQQLSLGSLKSLDMGKADEAFQSHLARAADDCRDRPLEAKARKVVLEVALVPRPDPSGDTTEVDVQIQLTSKIPSHRTKVYPMALFRNGAVGFNPDSPDNPNQATIFNDNEE